MREDERLPKRQDHSLAVYSAILGQRPAVLPPEDGRHRHPLWENGRLHMPGWDDLYRLLDRSKLSPNIRSRIEPLLLQARKCWCEARQRLHQHANGHMPQRLRSSPG